MTRASLIDSNPVKLHYYPFMISLDRYKLECNKMIQTL